MHVNCKLLPPSLQAANGSSPPLRQRWLADYSLDFCLKIKLVYYSIAILKTIFSTIVKIVKTDLNNTLK